MKLKKLYVRVELLNNGNIHISTYPQDSFNTVQIRLRRSKEILDRWISFAATL